MKQERPKGRFVPVDPAWVQRVKDELERRGWNQGDLADKIHATDAAVSDMLNGKVKSSRFVDDTNKVLDIAPPAYEDEIDQAMHKVFKRLRRVNRALFDKLVTDAEREVRSVVPDAKDKS